MSQENTNNYRDDEIDLRKLFQAIGKGFANIGKAVIKMIIKTRRISLNYKFLLITMIIVGAMAGVAYNKVSKPYFNTSMLLSSEYFNARLVDNNIDKLNTLCSESDRKGLAKALDIDVEIAKNIKGFEYEPLVSEQDLVDIEVLKQKLEELKVKEPDIAKVIEQIQIQNKNTYIITVQVYDNTIIGNLQRSLVEFFKNNPYVKNRIVAYRKNQIALISKLENDLLQIDSLKNLFNLNMKANAGRKGETSSVYVGESGSLNPVSFYSQSENIYRQMQRAQQSVELGDDFELIDGFTTFSKTESPSMKNLAMSTGLIFLGIGYLLIFLIEINKYLNRIEKDGFKN